MFCGAADDSHAECYLAEEEEREEAVDGQGRLVFRASEHGKWFWLDAVSETHYWDRLGFPVGIAVPEN
jgi:hypothetical protein